MKAVVFACALWSCVTLAAIEITQQVLQKIEAEFGQSARKRIESWQRLLNIPQDVAENRKLSLVNSFFNQVRFRSDLEHWGKEDYWATPLELLITNGGDCEDYSIAKYFTLRELGVSTEKLRITYVKALELNQAHMVLAYYSEPDAEPLILDNLKSDILPGSQREDLYPIYSFNGDGLWLAKQRGLGKRVGESTKLSQWTELNERLIKQLKDSL
ncbi:MAG: transglutaminase-like cysteine peptidase [Hahellaceae bacterium]|nr:transglutaminase-like cysteine peptidase [Hahellaceae bacterium]